MKIWLIERDENIGYDEFDEKVVVAPDEAEARRLASLDTGDEGKAPWLDPTRSVATEIGTALDPAPRIISASFNAG